MRTAELAQLLHRLFALLVEQEREDDVPAPPPDPEPRKLRQSERPGLDMRQMGENARDQARQDSYRRMFHR